MFDISNINFISSYIVTLDTNYSNPIISNYDIDSEDEVSLSFIENSILKLYSSNMSKWAKFDDENPSEVYSYVSSISEDLSNFKSLTKEIIQNYFEILVQNALIPNGDLIVTLFEMEEVPYLAFFKYNFKTMLTSKSEDFNEKRNITIEKKSSLYQTVRHKPDEGFIVHLKHLDICMLDKKYTIDNEKSFILKEHLLKCKASPSEKEKLKMFENVNTNIEKKYFLDDIEKKAELKKVIKDTVLDNGYISVKDVIDNSFEESPKLKEIYKATLEKTGLKPTENIEIDKRTLKNKFQIQKISTENGISIDIPIEYYGDKDKIEFVPDEKGTINIVIKNVKNIISWQSDISSIHNNLMFHL